MRTLLISTAAISMMPGLAYAQDQSLQPPAAAGKTAQAPATESARSSSDTDAAAQKLDATGLGDIIVTAQRQAESSQKAAIAINVVGGADLVNNGITQPERLNSLVPALTIANVGPSAT